jgi:hypothetical protein
MIPDEVEAPDPQLLVLRDAMEMRMAARGIFNFELDGMMMNHPTEGARAAIVIHVGKPWPSLATIAELKEEIGQLFVGGRIDMILSESVVEA